MTDRGFHSAKCSENTGSSVSGHPSSRGRPHHGPASLPLEASASSRPQAPSPNDQSFTTTGAPGLLAPALPAPRLRPAPPLPRPGPGRTKTPPRPSPQPTRLPVLPINGPAPAGSTPASPGFAADLRAPKSAGPDMRLRAADVLGPAPCGRGRGWRGRGRAGTRAAGARRGQGPGLCAACAGLPDSRCTRLAEGARSLSGGRSKARLRFRGGGLISKARS